MLGTVPLVLLLGSGKNGVPEVEVLVVEPLVEEVEVEPEVLLLEVLPEVVDPPPELDEPAAAVRVIFALFRVIDWFP